MELRDWGLSKLGEDIWAKKYQNNGESFDEWLDRVSGGNKDVRQLMVDKKFLFGGRILASRGVTDRKVTYSNCYVLPPVEDSIEGIYDTAKHLARTFSYGGGVGIDISNLRPKGSPVNNAAKTTSGAVSFMDTFSQVSSVIGQAGRRGALMISMDCNHKDIAEFIDAKKNTDKLEGCNISVKCSNEFIKESQDKRVKEHNLMRKLAENNWDYAEPGILYWDNINNYNLLSEYIKNGEFEYAGVNPCAEEPLPAGGSCLLGAINLSEFVINPFTNEAEFNINDFMDAVDIAVEALNEVLDEGLELHPLEMQRKCVSEWRQIGLGIMGFADMLIKLGIPYGSKESLDMIDEIGEVMNEAGIVSSAWLADKYGKFNEYNEEYILNSEFMKHINKSTKDMVKSCGLRNSQLFTIAPTGTISTMLGVSGGVEPLFDVEYTRTTKSLHGEDKTYKVLSPIVEQCMLARNIRGDYPPEVVWSKTINPFNRVDVQAQWQKYIDASISSTVNLPNETTVEEVEELYKYAWEVGCKGLTIFREGCKRTAILNSGSEKPKEEPEGKPKTLADIKGEMRLDTIMPITRADMGDRLEGATYVRQTACGKLYVTINTNEKGELVEVFIDPSKSGGCLANVEVIGRLCSTMLRAGVAVEAVIDSAKGVKCSSCARSKKKVDGLSCGDIVAKVIETEYERRKGKTKHDKTLIEKMIEKGEIKPKKRHTSICPECGAELSFTGGCNICPECGFSKCD